MSARLSEIAQDGGAHRAHTLDGERRARRALAVHLQQRTARHRNAEASDPFAVVVGAAQLQRLAREAPSRLELVACPQRVLRARADVESEAAERAAVLVQQRRA